MIHDTPSFFLFFAWDSGAIFAAAAQGQLKAEVLVHIHSDHLGRYREAYVCPCENC